MKSGAPEAMLLKPVYVQILEILSIRHSHSPQGTHCLEEFINLVKTTLQATPLSD